MEQPPTVEPPVFPSATDGADDPLKPEKSRTRLAIVGVLVAATLIVGGIVAAIAAEAATTRLKRRPRERQPLARSRGPSRRPRR